MDGNPSKEARGAVCRQTTPRASRRFVVSRLAAARSRQSQAPRRRGDPEAAPTGIGPSLDYPKGNQGGPKPPPRGRTGKTKGLPRPPPEGGSRFAQHVRAPPPKRPSPNPRREGRQRRLSSRAQHRETGSPTRSSALPEAIPPWAGPARRKALCEPRSRPAHPAPPRRGPPRGQRLLGPRPRGPRQQVPKGLAGPALHDRRLVFSGFLTLAVSARKKQ